MSECSNCFNGCREIISDQCVKYTGETISSLGIAKGDTLTSVEEKITDFLLTAINGTGTVPTISSSVICTLVSQYLPEGDANLNDVLSAIIKAACSLQVQVTAIDSILDNLEDDYVIGTCLTGVTASSGTHNILQAVIVKLCTISLSVTALQVALSQYVEIADINDYIADYLATQISTKMYTKMVPYTAVEYYEDIAGNFDATGAGIGDWEQIYLCNGQNGTPDKRGRVPVGCTTMGCTAFNVDVDPTYPGNPTYALLDTGGTNTVTLTSSTMPAHLHTSVSTITDPGHQHLFFGDIECAPAGGYIKYADVYGSNISPSVHNNNDMAQYYTKKTDNTTNGQPTNISVSTVLSNTGGGLAHNNIPPVLACNYIMYIPD